MYIKFNQFKKIKYEKPIKTHKKYISNATVDNDDVTFQLKKIKTPFGIYKENGIYKIDINLGVRYSKKFNTIEKLSIKRAHKNYKKWFNNEIDIETMENNFLSNVKHCNDEVILTIPLDIKNGKFLSEFYDNKKNRMHWKKITQNKVISVILGYKGMKFYKTKYGNEWEVKQIKCHEEEEKLYEQSELEEIENKDLILEHFCIEMDSDDEVDLDVEDDGERKYIDSLLEIGYKRHNDIEEYNKIQ